MVLAIAAITVWGIVAPRWNSTTSQTVAPDRASQRIVIDVPLWGRDGYEAVRARVDAMNQIHPNTDSGFEDGWWTEVRNVESQLKHFEGADF
jgi:hypothetical protein